MRVLEVEDELRMAALLKRGLEEDGYAVDVAATGPDDLGQAGEFGYDAEGVSAAARRGLMDAGADAHRPRRSRGPGPQAGRGRGRPPGQAAQLAELSARVRGGAVEQPTELRVAGPRLASATRRACVLSSKEFALLELFLRHPGILEQVWDFAYEGASNGHGWVGGRRGTGDGAAPEPATMPPA